MEKILVMFYIKDFEKIDGYKTEVIDEFNKVNENNNEDYLPNEEN